MEYCKEIGDGYSLEVDTKKADCQRLTPHWHLKLNGVDKGLIWAGTRDFMTKPDDVPKAILEEARRMTEQHNFHIVESYNYNAEHGEE